jgi:hypothetical protein
MGLDQLREAFPVMTDRELSRPRYSFQGVGERPSGMQYGEWMHRLRGRVFERVARGLPVDWPRARVLDVGSAGGFYVNRWHRLGVPRVVGVDISGRVALGELARRFPGDRFVQVDIGGRLPPQVTRLSTAATEASGGRVPVPGFDAVSAMDVLYRIGDDDGYGRTFLNIASLLKPGGWLLWSDGFPRRAVNQKMQRVSRPLRESEAAVRAAGFDIVDRRPMFVLMNYPEDTGSKLARWSWSAMMALVALAEPLGWMVGAALYALDRQLTRVMKESPSTEIMVCRRA